jgi:hypothetical protein
MTDEIRRRKRRTALIVIATVLGVPLIAYAVYRTTIGRSPLEGEAHHDFGVVDAPSGRVELAHTFHLRNRLDEPIEIVEVRPSCGCLVPELSTRTVEPGATLEIPVTLTLKGAGRTRERVALVMEGRGARYLTVEARR